MAKRKILTAGLAAQAALCVALVLALPAADNARGAAYLALAQAPFAQIGAALRALSLSGAAGNALAIILYAALSLLPAVFLFVRLCGKRARAEDWLLLAMSAYLFFMLWYMVNPGWIANLTAAPELADIGKASLGGVFYSILAGWLVLRLMRRVEEKRSDGLLSSLATLFAVMAAVLVFAVFYMGAGDLRAQISRLQSANTGADLSRLRLTYVFIGLRFFMESLPALLNVWILLLAIDLAQKLRQDRYGEAAVAAARRLARVCRRTVAAVLLAGMGLNLSQLAFSRRLLDVNYQTTVPLASVMLVLVLLLLARYFASSRQIKQDSDLII